jgi:hypothetical protein
MPKKAIKSNYEGGVRGVNRKKKIWGRKIGCDIIVN